MKLVDAKTAGAIEQATAVLEAGGTVAFPTDTVYGLGVRVDDTQAIEQLYTIKAREKNKAIAVLLSTVEDLERITQNPSAETLKLARAFWPGPLTLVVPRHPALPENLSSRPTVGVRIPDHAVALALLHAAGPLAVTSANISGGTNACTAEEVLVQLGERVDLVLDGGETPGGNPSTVAEILKDELNIFREGPISKMVLRKTLLLD